MISSPTPFSKVYRAWLEVGGTIIQALALPTTVKLLCGESDLASNLQMTFRLSPECTELSAIALGKKFEIIDYGSSTELLEAKPSKRIAKLKDSDGNGNFSLRTEDLSNAIAYYLHDSSDKSGEGNQIQIVSSKAEVTEDDQVAINSSGQIYVSQNLSGKTIKVRTTCVIPRFVNVLPDCLGIITAHIVAKCKDDSMKYFGLSGTTFSVGKLSIKNQLITVNLAITDTRVEEL